MRDLYSDVKVLNVANDVVIDLSGFESLTIGVNVSTGSTLKLQESDAADTGFSDVAAADYLGKAIVSGDGTGAKKLGYRGNKRYVKLVVGANITGIAVLGHPLNGPK